MPIRETEITKEDFDNLRAAYELTIDAAIQGDELAGAYFALCAAGGINPFPMDDDAFEDAEIRPF